MAFLSLHVRLIDNAIDGGVKLDPKSNQVINFHLMADFTSSISFHHYQGLAHRKKYEAGLLLFKRNLRTAEIKPIQ